MSAIPGQSDFAVPRLKANCFLMGRGRGKGKKVTAVPSNEDLGSGSGGNSVEEVVPTQKRRGRPTKPLKDDLDEEIAQKIEHEDRDDDVKVATDSLATGGETKAPAAGIKKRRRHLIVKDKKPDASPSSREENGEEKFLFPMNGSSKPNGCSRPNGNRRKSKPRRAAEVGVECRLD